MQNAECRVQNEELERGGARGQKGTLFEKALPLGG